MKFSIYLQQVSGLMAIGTYFSTENIKSAYIWDLIDDKYLLFYLKYKAWYKEVYLVIPN